jgi:transposase
MLNRCADSGNRNRFVVPPWTAQSPQWRAIDQRLPHDHLARRIARVVEGLDLTPLWNSYLGAGKKALPPDRLLQAVLYEMHQGRSSPAQWARDARDVEPLRWLLGGLEPSRSRWYDFRDRLAPFWDRWNAAVLHEAVNEGLTPATRVATDSSTVEANASRRLFLNEERLQKRREILNEHQRAAERGRARPANPPGWLAKSRTGLREQKQRYDEAFAVLRDRQAANAQRRSSKRKPAETIRVSPGDPQAILARDKLDVFRPLYTVQFVRDLDSPLIFAADVLAQNNDNGVLEPLIERMVANAGNPPRTLLADSGYVSMQHLEYCHRSGIRLYGPCQENDFSEANAKKPQSNQHTQLPKRVFRWDGAAQEYECPEGHRLPFARTVKQPRAEHTITLSLYMCPPQHCQSCPRQKVCTSNPAKGRTVSRMENEELLDELRERMAAAEAKELYKQRCRTVELSFADLKEHRGLRRLSCRGLPRARAEIASWVLTHNALAVEEHRRTRARATIAQTPLAA